MPQSLLAAVHSRTRQELAMHKVEPTRDCLDKPWKPLLQPTAAPCEREPQWRPLLVCSSINTRRRA